ncbi:hypothetical protein AAG906_018563 [Vitis piasezkii]
MEKTIKQEFEVKLDDVVHDDTYIGGSYHHDANYLKEKVLKDISVEEVYKLQFNFIDEAETFYNLFAKREARSLTRVGCEATFRIGLDRKVGKWIVKEFRGEHNHHLHEMVEKLGLNGNHWVTKIYVKCKRWAKAHLHGNFFGGMRSTQRAIMRIRQNEAKTEFEFNDSSPVLSTKLAILENHVAVIYTKESFLKFHEEMKNAELFFVVGLVSNDSMRAYTLSKFRHPNFK